MNDRTAPTHERELTEPVDLCMVDGRLNPAAVGWTRTPLHRSNLRGWGRTKRWEYWAIQSPGCVLALTVSSIDYLALHTVWFTDFRSEIERTAIIPLGSVELPDRSGSGEVGVRARGLQIRIQPRADRIRLRARTERVFADVTLLRPPHHESLGVVIPWSERRFQYTVKENGLPATGLVTADGMDHRLSPDSARGVLDHGRGRWPYRTTWNWGSGSGSAGDRAVGIQLGGQWTDGTGMTENALCLDGRLHKLGADLSWEYDRADWMRPWRVRDGDRVDLTFEPRYERRSRTEAVVVATEVHQCFGAWSGSVIDDSGERVQIDALPGFAEEARMRW